MPRTYRRTGEYTRKKKERERRVLLRKLLEKFLNDHFEIMDDIRRQMNELTKKR